MTLIVFFFFYKIKNATISYNKNKCCSEVDFFAVVIDAPTKYVCRKNQQIPKVIFLVFVSLFLH